ncbi:hypothetical protein F4678DRAFT_459524 [Xylaria arbuscula]|nr:hypothetical protein F4678DRAFT_459524 [Xylaria arbuscula]
MTPTEPSRHQEQPHPTHVQRLEMEVGIHYNFLQRLFREWFKPQEPQIHPGQIVHDVNPDSHEVVPKEFVAQACRDQEELIRANHFLEEITEKCDKLGEHCRALTSQLAKLRGTKEALDEKTDECREIRERWQAAIGELSDLKSSNCAFIVDDSEMTGNWKTLQYTIKNFARLYFRQTIQPQQLSEHQVELLLSISPRYQEFLANEAQVHLLFQSLVWKWIFVNFLKDPTMVWGVDVSKVTKKVFGYIKPRGPMENYHAWRAQTAQMIQGRNGTNDELKDCCEKELHRFIVQFLPENMLHSERNAEIIDRKVKGIIGKAIDLAVIFNQSRCDYRVRGVHHGHIFSSSTMEYYDEKCNAAKVDLMVSPALLKYGNSRGKGYDQHIVLAKSSVYSFFQDVEQDEDEDQDEGGELIKL